MILEKTLLYWETLPRSQVEHLWKWMFILHYCQWGTWYKFQWGTRYNFSEQIHRIRNDVPNSDCLDILIIFTYLHCISNEWPLGDKAIHMAVEEVDVLYSCMFWSAAPIYTFERQPSIVLDVPTYIFCHLLALHPQPYVLTVTLTHWVRKKWPPFSRRHLKCIFLNENVWVSIKILLKVAPTGPFIHIPALVQILAWRRPGDKALTDPMLVCALTYVFLQIPTIKSCPPLRNGTIKTADLILREVSFFDIKHLVLGTQGLKECSRRVT